MTWNFKKKYMFRCYVCVLQLTENLKQIAICAQMSVWSMLHSARHNQNGYFSTKFHGLSQQDRRTYYNKHKGVTLEHILSQVKSLIQFNTCTIILSAPKPY